MCFDTEQADAYTIKTPKARKQHRCCACPTPIMPGEVYQLFSYVADGTADSYKTCLKCVAVINIVVAAEHAEGCYGIEAQPPPMELKTALIEHDNGYGMLLMDDGEPIGVLPIAAHLFPELPVTKQDKPAEPA